MKLAMICPNFNRVEVNGMMYYFSYETCVAFTDVLKERTYVASTDENGKKWRKTTLSHLNRIRGGKDLVYEEWIKELARAEAERFLLLKH